MPSLFRICAAALVATISVGNASAQSIPVAEPTGPVDIDSVGSFGFSHGSFIVAPIPFQNPTLDSGLALGGAYLFDADPGSDSSSIGLGGFKTSNDSRGFGLGVNLNLGANRWQTSFVAADADLNYDLYIGEGTLPVRQSVRGGRLKFGYGVTGELTLGVGLSYAETSLEVATRRVLTDYERDARVNLVKGLLYAELDRRDDGFYPTTGQLLSAELSFGQLTNQRERSYAKGLLSAAAYAPVGSEGVLAGLVTLCAVQDDAPFFDACALGPSDAFRGYAGTQFIDNALLSVQSEYRGRIVGRLGYALFAGAGAVGSDLASALDGPYHAAAGAGLRYRLSKTFPVDYAVDVSFNDDGEELLYISVGQRF